MTKYIVRKNPNDDLWYVLGSIVDRTGNKKFFIPVSEGYKAKIQAMRHKDIQPRIDADAKRCLNTI